jgi:hypothetical protein
MTYLRVGLLRIYESFYLFFQKCVSVGYDNLLFHKWYGVQAGIKPLTCFVMCGCFDNCVGVVAACVLVFILFVLFDLCFLLLRLCMFILICFVCTSVKTTATKWKLNCSNNNNNNNNDWRPAEFKPDALPLDPPWPVKRNVFSHQ